MRRHNLCARINFGPRQERRPSGECSRPALDAQSRWPAIAHFARTSFHSPAWSTYCSSESSWSAVILEAETRISAYAIFLFSVFFSRCGTMRLLSTKGLKNNMARGHRLKEGTVPSCSRHPRASFHPSRIVPQFHPFSVAKTRNSTSRAGSTFRVAPDSTTIRRCYRRMTTCAGLIA